MIHKKRLDLLLVYPIWVKKGGRGKLQRMLPPLAVLSLAAYIESLGYTVRVVDLHAQELTPEEFQKILQEHQPRFLGMTVLSAHFIPAHHVAFLAKQEVPDCQVICGGVHAEANPEQMLQSPFIDAVCRGDGEEVLREFMQGEPRSTIKGLSFRQGSIVRHNPVRPVNMDLDRYPLPAYHLIEFKNYFPPAGSYIDLPAMNALMTRGCPGKCTFCNSASTPLRSRTAEKMFELIALLRSQYGVRQIYFYDDTFTSNPIQVRKFCELMIASKLDVKWICYVRGDMFSPTMADLLGRAGCHQVLMGVESGSESLMRQIGKPIDKEKYKASVRLAHEHGIEVRASFIIGHLDETEETMRETVDFAIDMDVDFFQLNILTPYPGTQLFREAKRLDLLVHEDYARYGQSEVVLKLRNLQAEQVLNFEKKAFLKFYFRPVAIWRQFKRLRRWAQFVDLFKGLYIIFLEGLSQVNSKNSVLQKWLEFDLEAVRIKSIHAPETPQLTYEARAR